MVLFLWRVGCLQENRSLSGIVLAGGQSRRMGRNKAWLEFRGRPLIEHVLDILAVLCDDLVIVADQTQDYSHLARTVPDVFKRRGALAGIHAGLLAMANDLAIVVGCDMPFLNVRVLRYMIDLACDYDVVVPCIDGYYEPLHAIYRQSCAAPIAQFLTGGPRRIIEFYDQVRVRPVSQDEISRFDPALQTLVNVNTPQEWQQVGL